MRIEELIIEGFKSYPVRTQISGWDSSFNAITGLNGSGKSNILDAICFVLGITNMSVMRAANQQDLIYKRGQAGVTKASVTIVFDNSDTSKSPDGYANCKQITVTRQIAMPNITKWLLNGHKAQQQQILNLFQSVQLNINNPNFVIMQGRITKVLNMRPQEILGMVEEAAGTRMFEDRKDKAFKTMARKEKKVDEYQADLEGEIKPKLEKLRTEKRRFMEYNKAVSELEHIARKLKAWEWMEGHRRLTKKEKDIQVKNAAMERVEKEKEAAVGEAAAAEEAAKVLVKKRDAEIQKGGKLKGLQAAANELEKAITKLQTQVELKNKDVAEEEGKVNQLAIDIEQTETAVESQATLLTTAESTYHKIRDAHLTLGSKIASDEDLLQTLLTGLSGDTSSKPSGGGGYMGQIAETKTRLAQAKTEEDQNKMKLGMSRKELAETEKRERACREEREEGERKLGRVRAEVEEMRARLGKIGWSEEREGALEARLREARAEVRNLGEACDRKKQGLSRLTFDYTDPYVGFNRSAVKGFAAQLFTLPEEHYDKTTALEVTAGGRLYNIVIQDEKVGKDLLDKGRLRKRVTFLPLTKISGRVIDPKKLTAAQSLAPSKVRSALSLVQYPPTLSSAISFVFGDTLICDDAASASLITFHPSVLTKSVTLAGDVYDPSGTMSGGSAPQGAGVLVSVQQLVKAERELGEARGLLGAVEREEEAVRGRREAWRGLKRELDLGEHALGLLEEQILGGNAARIATQVEEAKASIAKFEEAVRAAQEKQKAAEGEIKRLEKDMREFDDNKDGKIDELKARIKKQKAEHQKHAVAVSTKQREYSSVKLDLDQLQSDLAAKNKELDEAREGVAAIRKELAKLEAAIRETETEWELADAKLKDELATLDRFDAEIRELEKAVKAKRAGAAQAELELAKLGHDVVKLGQERVAAGNLIAGLERANEWIGEDKHLFGQPGRYDFAAEDMEQLQQRRKELQETQNGMKKKINHKVVNTLAGVEKREEELTKMLRAVVEDKGKIEGTIEELDQYKRDALVKTWDKVSKDFGDIFAELLPGNHAKLQPPEGHDLMDGLEVKVRLGTVWKQSLTELSGGQRSLIALSLIMALLQFKPAPMYILDEIDAALDLSHTQHIGQLFRTRFRGSQFIVVSLKEGLFTNANVLFKAKFRDGTSIVERTAQRSGSALYREEREGEEGQGQGGRRRGGRNS